MGDITEFAYDAAGRQTTIVDGNGCVTTNVYDNANRQTATISPLGYRTSSVYHAASRVIATINESSKITTTVYDKISQPLTVTNPLLQTHTYVYDDDGRQSQRIDARGQTTNYGYDKLNRQTSRAYKDGTRASFVYDKVGNRTLMHDWTGRYTSTFDDVNRQTVAEAPNSKTINLAYDKVSQRKTMSVPGSGTVTYTHDAARQLTKLSNPHGESTTLVYDAAGRTTRTEQGNGTKANRGYDDANRLTSVSNVNSGSTVLSSFDYVVDGIGNRTSVWETGTDVSNWDYDCSGQMTVDFYRPATTALNWYGLTVGQWNALDVSGWDGLLVNSTPTGGAGNMVFDPRGNRTSQTDPVTGDITTVTYDNGNQLTLATDVSGSTTSTYDNNGNQLTIEEPSGDITTNMWDGENRLVQVEHPSADITTYAYNADGLRVMQDDGVAETHFVYDGNNLLQETDDVGTTEAEFTYLPQADAELISQRRSGDSSFYQFDGIKNVRQLTDGSQVVTDEYDFDAWGTLRSSTGSTLNANTWQGQWLAIRKDPNAGPEMQYSTHFRQIDNGRFTSPDPAKKDLNLYRCDGNNPVNKADPSGLDENRGDVSLAPLKPLSPRQIGGLYDFAPPLKGESLDQWLAAFGYNLEGSRKEAWQQLMLAKAGITSADIDRYHDFSPQNQATMQKVYGYYTDVFVANPELLWAGMAKLAGNSVWNGLEMGDSFKPLSQLAPGGGPNKLIDTMQQELVKMNLEIIMDLGWVHEAYVTGGMDEIERLRSGKLLDRGVYSAFKDIHGGKLEGDQDRINKGNASLLKREQRVILERGYLELARLQDKGLDQGMAKNSISPIPGGKDFLDVVPGGDLTNFDDRWRWIETDMLPKWLAFSPAERVTLVQQPLGATPTALRNALLRDLADGLRSFLQHRKTDAEKIKDALNGPHP